MSLHRPLVVFSCSETREMSGRLSDTARLTARTLSYIVLHVFVTATSSTCLIDQFQIIYTEQLPLLLFTFTSLCFRYANLLNVEALDPSVFETIKKTSDWVDHLTREVSIDVTVYNPDLKLATAIAVTASVATHVMAGAHTGVGFGDGVVCPEDNKTLTRKQHPDKSNSS